MAQTTGTSIDAKNRSSVAYPQLQGAESTNRLRGWTKLGDTIKELLKKKGYPENRQLPLEILTQAFEGLGIDEQGSLNLEYMVREPYLRVGDNIDPKEAERLKEYHDEALKTMAYFVWNLSFHQPMNRGMNRKIASPPPKQTSRGKTRRVPPPPATKHPVNPPTGPSPPEPIGTEPTIPQGTQEPPALQTNIPGTEKTSPGPLPAKQTVILSASQKNYYDQARLRKVLENHPVLADFSPSNDQLCSAFLSLSEEEREALNLFHHIHLPYLDPENDFSPKMAESLRNLCPGAIIKMAEHIRDIVCFRAPQPHKKNSDSQPKRQTGQGQKKPDTPSPLPDLLPPKRSMRKIPPAQLPDGATREWIERVKSFHSDNGNPLRNILQEISMQKLRRNFGEPAEKLASPDQLAPFFQQLRRSRRQAQIFLLRFGNFDISFAEMAEELEMGKGTVHTHIYNVKKRFDNYLAELATVTEEAVTSADNTTPALPLPAAIDAPTDPAPATAAAPSATVIDTGENSPDPNEQNPAKEWLEQVITTPTGDLHKLLPEISIEAVNKNLTMRRSKVRLESTDQLSGLIPSSKPFGGIRFSRMEAKTFLARHGKVSVKIAAAAELFGIGEDTFGEYSRKAIVKLIRHIENPGELTADADYDEAALSIFLEQVKSPNLEDETWVQNASQGISLERIRLYFGELEHDLTSADQLIPLFGKFARLKATRQAQIFLLRFGNFEMPLARIAEELEISSRTVATHIWSFRKRLGPFLKEQGSSTPPSGKGKSEDLSPDFVPQPMKGKLSAPNPAPQTMPTVPDRSACATCPMVELLKEYDERIKSVEGMLRQLLERQDSADLPPGKLKEENPPEKKEDSWMSQLEIFHLYGVPDLMGNGHINRFLKLRDFRQRLNYVVGPKELAGAFKSLKKDNQEIMIAVFLRGEGKSKVGLRYNIVTNAGVRSRIKRIFELLNAVLEKSDAQPESSP